MSECVCVCVCERECVCTYICVSVSVSVSVKERECRKDACCRVSVEACQYSCTCVHSYALCATYHPHSTYIHSIDLCCNIQHINTHTRTNLPKHTQTHTHTHTYTHTYTRTHTHTCQLYKKTRAPASGRKRLCLTHSWRK